jgi:hypothetical protein
MMATIKIGDLLDFSSPLVASTYQGAELPQLAATVHHRPPNYTPEDAGGRRRRRERKPSSVFKIKVEREEEEKCPNVCVRNGVICTPYRAMKEDERREFTPTVHQTPVHEISQINSSKDRDRIEREGERESMLREGKRRLGERDGGHGRMEEQETGEKVIIHSSHDK